MVKYFYFFILSVTLFTSYLFAADPNFENYATIEGVCDGSPIYSLGNITYIYGVSPDFMPSSVMQQGNSNPKIKIKPKKSWEIESNWFGAYPAQPSVRTAWSDNQPFLPIHLIDGDPNTAWCSYGNFTPEIGEEWIRVDLPYESDITSISLICSQNWAMDNCKKIIFDTQTYEKDMLTDWMGVHRWAGRALPKWVKIEVSSNAMNWQKVYETNNLNGDENGKTLIRFDPVKAKQIRITARHFPRIIDKYVGYAFSIGEVEVYDRNNGNLAIISRGAGVVTSTTSYLMNQDRYTQQQCFAPVLYDLGLKWVVMCSDEGLQTWHNVEKQKGQLQVDHAFDQMITDLNHCGLKVIMGVDVKVNPIYLGRKLDWRKARYEEINNDYYDCPGWVVDHPELWNEYIRYIKFIAQHFKGRVAYYGFAADVPHTASMDFFAEVMGIIKGVDPGVGLIGGSDPRHYFPGSSIVNGQLRTAGRTMLLYQGISLEEGKVAVDLDTDGTEAGLLLNYYDCNNYVSAVINNKDKQLQLKEVVNGQTVAQTNAASIAVVNSRVKLQTVIKDSVITLKALDGSREVELTHRIEHLSTGGKVGIIWIPDTKLDPVAAPGLSAAPAYVGMYDNFMVTDTKGKVLAADSFDEPAQKASGWEMVQGQWVEDVTERQKMIIPSMTTAGGPLHARIDAGGTVEGLPEYFSLSKNYIDRIREKGFKGLFNYWFMTWSIYPPGPAKSGEPEFIAVKDEKFGYTDFRYWCDSEIKRAKFIAQSFVGSAGLDIMALYCNPYFASCAVGQSLFRVPEPSQIINPMQPDAGYYVLRSICTVMDGFKASKLKVSFDTPQQLQSFTYSRGQNEFMLAVWIPGSAKDETVETKTNITFQEIKAKEVFIIDLFNGTEQKLDISAENSKTVINDILVKDYPTLIRLNVAK